MEKAYFVDSGIKNGSIGSEEQAVDPIGGTVRMYLEELESLRSLYCFFVQGLFVNEIF